MTRSRGWAAFAHVGAAMAVIALITLATTIEALRIGPAAAGLLYLLPVLWVSAQAGLAAGLASAAVAGFCYNFFLLEPRYTLRIQGVGDVAAFAVLMVVALVTSRLASGLRAREIEARGHSRASATEGEFTAVLARPHRADALDADALAFLAERYGDAMLVRGDDLAAERTRLAPLDAAAAAWALHNGGLSGRGSEVMPAAAQRFVPLVRGGEDVRALAGPHRIDPAADQLALALARVWVQARDRLTAEAEQTARKAAEEREAVRRTLLAALGHDFRTPLTVLKSGLAEIGGEAATRLGREVDRIARLGEDLIAAARIESGQPVRVEPVDLVDTIAAATPVLPGSAVTVTVTLPDDLPLVQGDAVMLVHVIGNLLDNAVRHASTAVSVVARAVDHMVEVDVADDGGGIDPAIADVLFGRFVTGSDRRGGSGLGLSIARDMAQAMGATLRVVDMAHEMGVSLAIADRHEGGACFRLTLPAFAPLAVPA